MMMRLGARRLHVFSLTPNARQGPPPPCRTLFHGGAFGDDLPLAGILGGGALTLADARDHRAALLRRQERIARDGGDLGFEGSKHGGIGHLRAREIAADIRCAAG